MKNECIFFHTAAEKYTDAIPVGNGRLGAMVCGGLRTERINLNDDTLWSGYPRTNTKDFADRFTSRLRKKILEEEDYYGAEDFADRLQGPYNESFITAGEFILHMNNVSECQDYVRGLDMKNGIAFTEYKINAVQYRREVFSSFHDDLIVIHMTADSPGALSFSAEFDSIIPHETETLCEGIALKGRAPRHVEPQYAEYTTACQQAIVYDEKWENQKGLRFECHAKAVVPVGSITYEDGKITVSCANEATIYLWVGTNFSTKFCENSGTNEDYCIRDLDIAQKAGEILDSAIQKGYDIVRENHISDMNAYFNRVCFQPQYDVSLDELSTPERKARYKEGLADAGFEKQLFDFGRYLLYSSSRPGTQAANLQGIWCWEMRPSWSSNYTININTQMNYWGVETMNMPECHLPLMELLCGMEHTGKKTAASLYGARGFCAHHNVDLWRATCPIGLGNENNMYTLFTTGGIWLSLHVWEHYLFTRDLSFLKKYYHIIKGASLFAIDMMCEMKDGYLGICPATVPERRFFRPVGEPFCVGAGSTFDYELVTELFDGAKQAAVLVGDEDSEFLAEMETVRKKFPPIPISENGQILFWQFECESSPYLWLDHLYGIYPGYCLTESGETVLSAAKKTLEEGDMDSYCFGNCWYAGAWARIGRADKAYQKLRHHISHATFDSLLGLNHSYPDVVFQIDSNLGIIAVVGELLLQSTPNKIIVAPALPKEWSKGSITGLQTRTACQVSMKWEENKPTFVSIASPIDQTVNIEIPSYNKTISLTLQAGKSVFLTKEDFCE